MVMFRHRIWVQGEDSASEHLADHRHGGGARSALFLAHLLEGRKITACSMCQGE